MGRRLRIGFLGAGLIATYHSKSLRRSGGDRSFAPVSSTRTRSAPKRSRRRRATPCATARTRCSTAATRCTSARGPASTSARSAKAGRRNLAMFCEKPLAIRRRDAERMAAMVAERRGRQPGRSGAAPLAGLPVGATSDRRPAGRHRDGGRVPRRPVHPDPGPLRLTWRGDRALVGSGTLLEHSIHDVDMLRVPRRRDRPGQRAHRRTSTVTTASRTSPARRSASRTARSAR